VKRIAMPLLYQPVFTEKSWWQEQRRKERFQKLVKLPRKDDVLEKEKTTT